MSSPRDLYEYLKFRGIKEYIARAFLEVPREYFVFEREPLWQIYSDSVVITYEDEEIHTTSSQPSLMAQFMEELDIKEGSRVLEIGGGTGYNAAVMAKIVGETGLVVSIEYNKKIYDLGRKALERAGINNVIFLNKDGFEGEKEYAPYDAILSAVGVDFVPKNWFEQLKDGGRLIAPLNVKSSTFYQPTLLFWKENGWIYAKQRFATSFIKAGGKLGNLAERVYEMYHSLRCEDSIELPMAFESMGIVEVLSASVCRFGVEFFYADGKGKAKYSSGLWRGCGDLKRLSNIINELEKSKYPSLREALLKFDINRESFEVFREGF